MEMIGRFVVLKNHRTSDISRVNDTREQLVAQKTRSLETIPPTLCCLGATHKACQLQVQLLEYSSASRSTDSNSSWMGMGGYIDCVAVVLAGTLSHKRQQSRATN